MVATKPVRQVLSVARMQAVERALIDQGVPATALMERAGSGAGEWVRRVSAGRAVTVLCGPGNNGGDGYVIARHLATHGQPVTVIAARPPATPEAKAAAAAWTGPVVTPAQAVGAGDVLVDCLFGSGLARPLPDDLFFLLTALAESHRLRIAIDLPSGIDADSGAPLTRGLPPWHMTLALGAWKFAHWTMPGAALMGERRLVGIGIAPVEGAAQLLARPVIAPPPGDTHKYQRGLVGIVAGAMPGAALLAAEAAQRAGAGYVRLLGQAGTVPPDLVQQPIGSARDLAEALADPRWAATLVGPGLGRDAAASAALAAALAREVPLVIDADALALFTPALAGSGPLVLTPHAGEMATLEGNFGLPGTGTRRARAQALAAVSGAVVVFKGPDSLIAAPDGALVLGPGASSWLSVAGSGDVLAGVITSRLAVTGDPWQAAQEGLWLHGRAGALAGAAFTASDLARAIGAAVSEAGT